ncbi:Eukaryotic and archaeal DNA primase large subunit [Phytophthora infestans]|uniref:Eukaryotic and archaeal DNA primase large subunit n=1 Tax=Phytophthora infestans TaxID=4787 RepID=A0A833WWG3_PHYIN|nr:Eukaryotic and archaeal DNA primase large subunit [Phytophthora infestans]
MSVPVSFYRSPPQQRVSLDNFQELGRQRVKLLTQINARWSSYSALKPPKDMLNEATELQEGTDTDLLSHYALRLAFCRVSSGWDWLVRAETKLFAARLRKLPPYTAVAVLEREGIKHELLNEDNPDLDKTQGGIYRVPFVEAPRLVKYREVVIHDGFCLVPLRRMDVVAVYHFRRCLEEQMRDLQCAIPAQGPELERLTPILDGFVEEARVLTGTATSLAKKADRPKLEVKEIDRVAEKHFPLCMKQLHRKLRENHHLKYDGRVQYRMFLKGAGLSVHECIQLFRSEFIKTIPAAKFDKEYTYHIRHSYGLEGSRKDYAPLDCEQIISGGAPSHGQYHGCPFKHWGRPALQDELRRHGLSLQTTMEITQQASAGNCQSACRAFFEATHSSTASPAQFAFNAAHLSHQNGSAGESIAMHPNAYLNASRLATLE